MNNDLDKITAAIILIESVKNQTTSLRLVLKLLQGQVLNLTKNLRGKN
jgi:hypothetical protein